MDLAGRHTSQFDHPALSQHLSIIQTPLLCKWALIEAKREERKRRKKKKTLPSFHAVVMCADAWDSRDLSAVTYGIAGEMERAARSPIPHLLVGEGSIRPEPLQADLSERHAQMVTLSCSSLATAASAGPFHRNAQLLSYRD